MSHTKNRRLLFCIICLLSSKSLVVSSKKRLTPICQNDNPSRRYHATREFENFFATFCGPANISCDAPVGCTQDPGSSLCHTEQGVYNRKEVVDPYLQRGGKPAYLIDCLRRTDNDPCRDSFRVKRWFVSWAALSFATRRNYQPSHLLKTLRQLRGSTPAPHFISFRYQNTKVGSGAMLRFHFKDYLKAINIPVTEPNATDARGTTRIFDDAVEMYKGHRFNIAFENANRPGWITEKIINSFLAGSIPVYYGSPTVFRYFNKKAMVYANDFKTVAELAAYVVKLYSDVKRVKEIMDQPPCTREGLKSLFWWRGEDYDQDFPSPKY